MQVSATTVEEGRKAELQCLPTYADAGLLAQPISGPVGLFSGGYLCRGCIYCGNMGCRRQCHCYTVQSS